MSEWKLLGMMFAAEIVAVGILYVIYRRGKRKPQHEDKDEMKNPYGDCPYTGGIYGERRKRK